MNDRQLILLLKNAPSEGLSELIARYGGQVKWIVEKIIGTNHPRDVEECVSDAFLRLWQNIDRFHPENGTPLRSYLFGIARYAAIDCKRRNLKIEDPIPAAENDLTIEVDFTDKIAETINTRILQESIDSLPEPDRQIFILRYFLEQPISAIAQQLSLSQKAVENKLYRGKKLLKTDLIERGIIR